MVGTANAAEVLAALENEAVRDHGVPRRVSSEARAATERFLRTASGDTMISPLRVRSYFWAVVRRTCNRSPDGRDVAVRFVLEAALADLRAVETPPDEAWDRLQRDWTGRVPDHVLEEFGRKLCA